MSEAPLFRKRGPKGRGAGKAREKSVEKDDGSGSSDSDAPTITVKQRRLTSQKNPLFQKTTRRATDRTEELDHKYTATSGLEKRDAAAEQKEDATRTVEIDAVEDAEAKRLLERHMAESEMEGIRENDGVYRGTGGYRKFAAKGNGPVDAKMSVGPQRAPAHLRVTSRFDYQPNICKDYKETGFCGYGDSCIFLHDRGDYKSGWQLDKEWDEQQKAAQVKDTSAGAKGDGAQEVDSEDVGEDGLPFACFICRKGFTRPVVTKCGHYFCEACALARFQKTTKCAACNGPTGGIFNAAKKLQAKLDTCAGRIEGVEIIAGEMEV